MTGFLSESELAQLTPAELLPHQTPIPTQVVSSNEFAPDPQNEKQREVEARLLAIGDNTHKEISKYPWRMDDEKVTYKGYEKMVKAGIKNVCVHKGLFPPVGRKAIPAPARLLRRRRRRSGG